MSTSARSSPSRGIALDVAGALIAVLLSVWIGHGEARASACGDGANRDYADCQSRAIEQEKKEGRPPGKDVSLRFKLKLAFCAQSLERDLNACGLLRDDVKHGDEGPKGAKREPLLVMCDDKADGSCHIVFKDPGGLPRCGRLSKPTVVAMGDKLDLNTPELAVGALNMCPDEVLIEHGRNSRPHRGPDIKTAKSKLDFDCIDDDPTARWAEGYCYGVVREERGDLKCASVQKSRVRRREGGGLTAHRWDIVTDGLEECPRKIWNRYHKLNAECTNPFAACPLVERSLWTIPRVTVPVRPTPVRATPAPVPAPPPPPHASPDKGSVRGKSGVTGYELDKKKRELGIRPDAPVERPRVGGVKVDVQSEGTPEDLSAARNEILKMRKGQ